MAEIRPEEKKAISFDYELEDRDIKAVLFNVFKKMLNYCSGKVDFDSLFNYLTDGLKYLSVKRIQLKINTFYSKISIFEMNTFIKYLDGNNLGLLYYDDYDMKLLKPMQLIAEKLNINLVRNDDIAPILTTESKVNNTLIKF